MDSEGQPVSQQSMKKGKNDTNASASPIPREPFDLAQLKAYGKTNWPQHFDDSFMWKMFYKLRENAVKFSDFFRKIVEE